MSRHRKYPLPVILDLYATGIAQAEVARQLGIHHTTVGYALRVAGVEPVKRPPLMRVKREKQRTMAIGIARRRLEIVRLYAEEKLSTPQIAALLHMGRTTVYENLRAGGICSMRPKGLQIRKTVRIPRYFRPEPVSTVERLLTLAARKKGWAA